MTKGRVRNSASLLASPLTRSYNTVFTVHYAHPIFASQNLTDTNHVKSWPSLVQITAILSESYSNHQLTIIRYNKALLFKKYGGWKGGI